MGILANSSAISAPAGGADFYEHQIASSIRNSASQNGTLKFTAGTPTSSDKFTMSYWVKRYDDSNTSSDNVVFTSGTGGGAYMFWSFASCNFQLEAVGGNWAGAYMISDAEYRDTSAYYHHVLTFDSTQSTQADRLKVYVNGERITSWSTESITAGIGASEDFSFINQSGVVQAFGGLSGVGHGVEGADLQMAEIVFIDGLALTPTSFGESKNGVWIPKDPSELTFGNNGYWLKMASGAIGTDSSGNSNNFSVNNIAAHDVMLDSPTFNSDSNGGNMCTWNPLDSRNVATPTEGNLKATHNGSLYNQIRGTMSIGNSGKWYMELYKSGTYATYPAWGICDQSQILTSSKNIPGYYAVSMIGVSWDFNSEAVFKSFTYADSYGAETNLGSTASTYTGTAQIIGMAIDLDNNKIFTHVNGSWDSACGNPSSGGGGFNASGLNGVNNLVPVLFPNGYNSPTYNLVGGFGADSTFGGLTAAGSGTDTNGYGNFKYAVPTDYKAICQGNISVADAIDPAQTDDNYPKKLFSPIIYTGNGGTLAVTGLGFKPDFVSIRRRNAGNTPPLYDSSRGNTKLLVTTATQAEYDQSATPGLSAFGTDGFTVEQPNTGDYGTNRSSALMVAWCQRANGGITSTNSLGSLSVTQQVDPSGGFSISTYSGDGGTDTIGHGLSRAPTMVIVKQRNGANNWAVYAKGAGATKYAYLDSTAAFGTAAMWNNTTPSSSLVYLGDNNEVNAGSRTYVAYCFADTEGFIKSGSYVGNGSGTDGTFVYTGFKPAFLMIKKITSNNWRLQDNARDPFNPVYHSYYPNSAAAEDAYTDGTDYNDFLSNGFKLARGGDTANWNASGSTFTYLAFAENPFKYSLAR